ncbi:MAG: hypothetical protein ACYS7M_07670 [Planctomycetota bacterium]|jgi:hypothetical protein
MEDFLKGKKTYLVAAVGLIGAVAAWANGFFTIQEGSIAALLITLASTLRAAIGKLEE